MQSQQKGGRSRAGQSLLGNKPDPDEVMRVSFMDFVKVRGPLGLQGMRELCHAAKCGVLRSGKESCFCFRVNFLS